jgi:hypothetical protein
MGQSHIVHFVHLLIVFQFPITHDATIIIMKAQCITKSDLFTKLKCKFLNRELTNALRIIYWQYWLPPDCESTFVTQLSLIISHYYAPKKLGTCCSLVVSHFQGMFWVYRRSFLSWLWKFSLLRPWNENLVTKLWRQLSTNNLQVVGVSEFIKLAKMTSVQVTNNVN